MSESENMDLSSDAVLVDKDLAETLENGKDKIGVIRCLNETNYDLLVETKAVNGVSSVDDEIELGGKGVVTMEDSEDVKIDEPARLVKPDEEVDLVKGKNQAVGVDSGAEINGTDQVDAIVSAENGAGAEKEFGDAVLVGGDLAENLRENDKDGANRVETGLNGTKIDLLAEKEDCFVDDKIKSSGQQNNEQDITMRDSETVKIYDSARQVDPSKEVNLAEGENEAVKADIVDGINKTEVEVAMNGDSGATFLEESDDDDSSMDTDSSEQGIVNFKSTASKHEFHYHNLVWGKIKTHPWWPGQIINPSAASKKAKKYFKKNTYLVAYFGDNTFSWNTPSQIKPFLPYFAQFEKHSELEEFHYAIDDALEEVSRRVELSLACPGIPDDVYAKIKTQIFFNPGITEESSKRDDGDSVSSASAFEPRKPLEFINALAQQPLGSVDKLEFITTRAQLLAFYRWKGYSQLPELQYLGGLLECDANIPLLKNDEQVASQEERSKIQEEKSISREEKSKVQGVSSMKGKHISDSSSSPGENEESLSEWIANKKRCLSKPNCMEGSDNKADDKLISSSSSGKKRKLVDSVPDDNVGKHKEVKFSSEAAVKPSQPKKSFGVGNIILKVASKLHGTSPILKNTAKELREVKE
ncbi:hypothetical protein ACFE04_000636 [Oxalis oulophora]